MAKVQIAFCDIGRDQIQIAYINGCLSAEITSSGTNQQSPAGSSEFVCVSTDGAIYIAIGQDPDATVTTSRRWIPLPGISYFACNPGDKVAVITG